MVLSHTLHTFVQNIKLSVYHTLCGIPRWPVVQCIRHLELNWDRYKEPGTSLTAISCVCSCVMTKLYNDTSRIYVVYYVYVMLIYVPSTDTDSGYASLPPTSLSQDSYDYLPATRPGLESSFSFDPSSSSSPSHSALTESVDGAAMSHSLDRRLL